MFSLLQTGGLIMMLGPTDVGKSTFSLALANAFAVRKVPCGVVDADPGQSEIGPPTTIGAALMPGAVPAFTELAPLEIFFIGSTSPAGHLLPSLTGVVRCVSACRDAGAETVILDMPGYVRGAGARALAENLFAAIRPDVVVALQHAEEIAGLLSGLRGMQRPALVSLKPPDEARKRGAEERAARRRLMFAAYFADGRELELDGRACAFVGMPLFSGQPVRDNIRLFIEKQTASEVVHTELAGERLLVVVRREVDREARSRLAGSGVAAQLPGSEVMMIPQKWFGHRLVGLADDCGRHLAVGTVERVDFDTQRLVVRAPLRTSAAVRQVILGSMRVSPEGAEVEHAGQGQLDLFASR